MAQKKDETSSAAERAARQAAEESTRGIEAAARQAGAAGEQVAGGARRGVEQASRAGAEAWRFGQQETKRAAELGRAQTEQMDRLLSASASAYRDLAEWSHTDVARVSNSQARLARGLQEMGWELMRFTQDTWRSGLRTANDMARCRSVEDMTSLQQSFFRETMDQWLDGSARLLRIGSDTASQAVGELQSAVEKAEEIGRRGQRAMREETRPPK